MPLKLALLSFLVSTVLATLAGILFKHHAWGLNVWLLSLMIISGWFWLKRQKTQPISPIEWGLAILGMTLAAGFVWRDSHVLNMLALLAIITILILGFSLTTRQTIQRLSIPNLWHDAWSLLAYSLGSGHQLALHDVAWQQVQTGWGGILRSIGKGLLLTLPLLVIFGGLLIQSDTRFGNLAEKLFVWDFADIVDFLWIYILAFYGISSFYRLAILNANVPMPREALINKRLGSIEISIMLGMLNLLFMSYLWVQSSYFFGGDALVQNSQYSYAEYARKGFFELVWVTLLVILLLLICHRFYQPKTQTEIMIYRWLAGCMIGLVLIIESSACHRMWLYTQSYGLTELRFYTSIFMAWLVILFIIFTTTVLRNSRISFTLSATMSGILVIMSLHIINPDAIIAKTNLQRSQQVKLIDYHYLTQRLSLDAVPTLLTTLNQKHCKIVKTLRQNYKKRQRKQTWQSWRWSQYQAGKMLQQYSHCQ